MPFQGNLFLVQTTETAVAKKWAWENEDFPRYLDVALVRPDEIVVAAITDARRMKVFDVVGKDLVGFFSPNLVLMVWYTYHGVRVCVCACFRC